MPSGNWGIYDGPEAILQMAVDGELTRRGAFNAIVAPSLLSPKERTGFIDRIKEATGNQKLTNAMIEVAFDPWTLFLVATSPIGGSAGDALTNVASKATAYARKHPGLFQVLGMVNPASVLRGTKSDALFQHITGVADSLRFDLADMGMAAERVAARNGLKTLDPRKLAEGEAAIAREIQEDLMASLSGMGREVNRGRLVRGKGGKAVWTTDTIAPRLSGLTDEGLAAKWGEEFLDLQTAHRSFYKKRLIQLAGKETPENLASLTFVPDPDKLINLHSGARSQIMKEVPSNARVAGVLSGFIDDASYEALAKGSADDFVRYVGTYASKAFAGADSYVPLNTMEVAKGFGAPTGEAAKAAAFKKARSTSKRLYARTSKYEQWEPTQLSSVMSRWGATEEGAKHLRSVEKRVAKAAASNRTPYVLRMDATEAASRYHKETAATYIWHSNRVPDDIGAGVARASVSLGGKQHTASWASATQVLEDDFPKILDPHARRTITHFLVPHTTGASEPKYAAMGIVNLGFKKFMRAVVDSPFGKLIDNAADGRVSRGLRDWTNADLGLDDLYKDTASEVEWLANWMYGTHLGLNPASAMQNLLQPWMQGATWLGPRALAHGYANMFREMGGYLKERAGMGFRVLSDVEDAALKRRHFAGANFHGEDILGITSHRMLAHENEAAVFLQKAKSPLDKFMAHAMSLFSTTEMSNRSVMFHAAKWKRASLGMPASTELRDIRTIISESQFTSNFYTRPLMMSTRDSELAKFGPIFNNPLMAQFLTFPTRMFTSAFLEGPKFGGGVRRVGLGAFGFNAPAAVIDPLRALAFSNAVYEIIKETVNIDVGRSLYAGAATDAILPRDGGWLPTPPIIDIGKDSLTALVTHDRQMLYNSIARVGVPGGVAIRRAIDFLPDLPGDLQRSYIDWRHPNEAGEFPLYDNQGRLIGYRGRAEAILGAAGLDYGKVKGDDVEKYVLGQREAIRDYKKRMLQAMRTGNQEEANRVAGEFRARYGFDLKVTPGDLKRAARFREVPRVNRLFEQLPDEVEQAFQAAGFAPPPTTGEAASALPAQGPQR